MFKDLLKAIPLWMKLVWAVGAALSLSLIGFLIWFMVSLLDKL